MDDAQKIELIKEIMFSRYDWMRTYRETFEVPDGIGLPSGITGFEVAILLIKRVVVNERVIIVKR